MFFFYWLISANMRLCWILFVFILALFGVYCKIDFYLSDCTMIKYSATELLQLRHSQPLVTGVLETQLRSLQLLRQPKYVHPGSRRNLHSSGAVINTVWSQRRLDRRHLSSRHVCSANFSYLQKSTPSSCGVRLDTIRFAHLNTRSINNKAASLCDIVLDKKTGLLLPL